MTNAFNLDMRSEKMPVGDGYTVSFTYAAGRLDCRWAPRLPHGRKGRRLLPANRLARDEFVRRIAERSGLVVAVVEA